MDWHTANCHVASNIQGGKAKCGTPRTVGSMWIADMYLFHPSPKRGQPSYRPRASPRHSISHAFQLHSPNTDFSPCPPVHRGTATGNQMCRQLPLQSSRQVHNNKKPLQQHIMRSVSNRMPPFTGTGGIVGYTTVRNCPLCQSSDPIVLSCAKSPSEAYGGAVI